MLKKLPLILGLLIAAGLLLVYISNAYDFFSKSYLIDETNLYKIDTFHLLARAYQSQDAGGRRSEPKLVFESTTKYGFAIGGNVYQAISDRQKLEYTLMYHDLKFTVYSTKEVYEIYKTSRVPIFIPVYQIQVGEIKYIHIAIINKIAKGKLLRGVIIPPVVVLFIFIVVYSKISWTDRKRLLFAVIFILTIFGILILSSWF